MNKMRLCESYEEWLRFIWYYTEYEAKDMDKITYNAEHNIVDTNVECSKIEVAW